MTDLLYYLCPFSKLFEVSAHFNLYATTIH